MSVKRIAICIVIFCSFFSIRAYAQEIVLLEKQFSQNLERAIIETTAYHSAIKPYTVADFNIDTTLLIQNFNYGLTNPGKAISIIPYSNITIGKSINKKKSIELSAGTIINARIGKKWAIQLNAIENLLNLPNFENEKIDSNKVVPHFGRYASKTGNFYQIPQITGILNYSPTYWASLSIGNGKNFIGDGYRSLLLSDNAATYPFAKLEIKGWRLKYEMLWLKINDIESNSGNKAFQEKYAAIHYLSYNITDRLNIGFFEAIVWRGKDSTQNRGFDPSYLNPIIFLRPVEFSLNSPDNANLGGSFKIRLWKKTFIYSQLFIDDFIVSEFTRNRGWWGNKYAIQFGAKSYNFGNIKGLFAQAEYNYARPYTYSHATSLTNYGYSYQPLAHPLGANFHELVCIANYTRAKWWINMQITTSVKGIDSTEESFGGNIYKSYTLRPGQYGVGTIYGQKELMAFPEISVGYILIPKWNLVLHTGYKGFYSRINSDSKLENYFFIGIRTCLFNNETDYK